MPKRGENIYKRKDNRWEGRFAVLQPDGSSKYISVYAKSYAEVKAKLQISREKQFLLAPVQADGEKSFSELAGC